MTQFPALLNVVAATSRNRAPARSDPHRSWSSSAWPATSSSSGPSRPRPRRPGPTQGSGYEVGDEVQTIGGVMGTILEIHGDRYTLLTGALGNDGNLDGAQPTRIVFVRQAIARKIEPIGTSVDDEPRTPRSRVDEHDGTPTDHDIDDVGGRSARAGTSTGRLKRREPEVVVGPRRGSGGTCSSA